MTAANIHLSIHATSNLGAINAQVAAMRKGLQAVGKENAVMQQRMLQTGRFNAKEFGDVSSNVNQLRRDYQNLLNASGQYSTATRTVTAATTRFNDALGRQKLRLRDVIGQSDLVRASMKEQMALNNMMVTAWSRDATGKMSIDMAVPKEVDVKNMSNLRAQMGYYNQILRSTSQEMVNWGKNTQWAGRQLTVGFSVPVSIAAGLLTRFAATADAELVRITKVYGDAEGAFETSNESIRRMAQDTAKYIADQYGIAASETRTVMGELAATGMQGSELQGMTGQVQRMALLGDMNPDESLRLARILKEVYGATADEIGRMANYFNAVENSTALTMQDVAEGLPRIAGIMKSTGVSLEEQTELLVAFKAAGIDVAEGANALKSINFKAIAATPTAANAFFRITGENMQDLVDKTEGQFVPMMMEIAEVMDGLDQQDKVDLIARVFGIHQGSRTITLLEQLREGSEMMMRAQAVGMQDSADQARTAAEEIRNIQESMSNRGKRMLAGLRVVAEELGQQFLVVLVPIGEAIVGILNKINNLSDTSKKLIVWGSILLAAFGPFVMFIGLMGNLIGMTGRGISQIANLGVSFKILTAESKASQIIQQMFGTEIDKNNALIREQVAVMDQLTQAIKVQNEEFERSAEAKRRNNEIDIQAPFSERVIDNPSNVYGPDGRGQAGPTTWRRTPAIEVGSWDEYLQQRPEGNFDSRQARREFERTRLAASQIHPEVAKANAQISSMTKSIGMASGAMFGLGLIIKNDTLQNVSMVAMAIASLQPAISALSTRWVGAMGTMAASSNAFAARASAGMLTAVTSVMAGLGRVAAFLTGPFGLAFAAASAIAWKLWDNHKKKAEETRAAYADLADTAEGLGKVYGFMPSTRLEMEMRDEENYDPFNFGASQARMQDMKENSGELYTELMDFSERARKITDEHVRSQEMLNEALSQGAIVMAQTGDHELAKQAAWDIYQTISGEFLSFEQFEAKVSLVLDEDSLDQFYQDANHAAHRAAERTRQILRLSLEADVELDTPENMGKLERSLRALFESIDYGEQESAYRAISTAVGDETMFIHQEYNRALEAGLLKDTDTIEDFIDKWDGLYNDYAGMAMSEFGEGYLSYADLGYDADDVEHHVNVFRILQGINDQTGDILELEGDLAGVLTGRVSRLQELQNRQENMNLLAEKELLIRQGFDRDSKEVREIEFKISLNEAAGAQLFQLEQVTEGVQKRFDGAADRTGNFIGALNELGVIAAGTGDSLEEMSDDARKALDNWQSAMQHRRSRVIDHYRGQLDDFHDSQRSALQREHDDHINDINTEHDGYLEAHEVSFKNQEKSLEANHKARQKALKDQQEREKENLDREKKAAQDALNDANDAAKKAFDARRDANREAQREEQKALRDRFKQLGKELDREQEARRDAIAATYDAQIEKINQQIEAEDRLEKQRQRMYENERNRISRMRELFSDNLSLNMALNTGDIDEAARLANDMRSKQSDWAQQDLSAISSDASQTRQEALRGRIDVIEERKSAQLDAIKEVEEAEKEALALRQEREEAELEAKYKRIEEELQAEREKHDKLHKLAREALDEDFSQRQKALNNRHSAESEALREATSNEKDELRERRDADKTILDERRDNAIQSQKEANDDAMQRLQDRQKEAERQFGIMADHWSKMQDENRHDAANTDALMASDFGTLYAAPIFSINQDTQNQIWEETDKIHKQGLERLADSDSYEKNASRIAGQVMKGVFGVSLKPDEIRDWIETGIFPAGGSPTVPYHQQVIRPGMPNARFHTGGVIGEDSGGSVGPGFHSRSQEIAITALKGEGVANLRAMRTPGFREMLHAANTGEVPRPTGGGRVDYPRTPHRKAKTGDAPVTGSLLTGITGIMASLAYHSANQIASQMLNPMQFSVDMDDETMQRHGLSAEQLRNASAIISQGHNMGASPRDIIIALMTAMQESSLRNINYGDDIHGVRNPDGSLTSSVGLFQQQKWWGSLEERMNPASSARLFYEALFNVGNRNSMSLTQAAQAVQGSAHPNAYAKWENLANTLFENARFMGMSGFEDIANYDGTRNPNGMPWQAIWEIVRRAAPESIMTSNYRPGSIVRGTNQLSYHAMGRAIDIISGNMPQTFRKIKPLLPWTQLIYTPMGNQQMYNGRNFMYTSPITQADHYDHIHLAYQNGGLVGGRGFGDIMPAMLEPGEFVVRRAIAQRNMPFLEALNSGEIDFTPVTAAMAHARFDAANAANIDRGSSVVYDINMQFTGDINHEVDVENAVRSVLHKIDSRRPQSRRA